MYLTNENDVVAQLERVLAELISDRERLERVTAAGLDLRARTSNLGCEGAGHKRSALLGAEAGSEATPSAA